MKRLILLPLVLLSLGLTGCATTSKEEASKQAKYTPKSEEPVTANHYWAEREKDDVRSRARAGAQNTDW